MSALTRSDLLALSDYYWLRALLGWGGGGGYRPNMKDNISPTKTVNTAQLSTAIHFSVHDLRQQHS